MPFSDASEGVMARERTAIIAEVKQWMAGPVIEIDLKICRAPAVARHLWAFSCTNGICF